MQINVLDKQTLENWFITRLITDVNFCKIIKKEFDARWLKSKTRSAVASILLSFADRYDRTASLPELTAILQSAASKADTKLNAAEITELLSDITNTIQTCQSDLISTSTSDFVKRQAAWCAIIDNVNDIEKNPDATIDKCLRRLNDVQTLELIPTNTGFEYFDTIAYNTHFDTLLNPESRLPTGWDTLDAYTHGGLLSGGKSLYLFIGQPGLGKSLFLSNITVNLLKQNKTVVVISLEMSENIYAQRFDAHISGIDINQLNEHESTVKTRLANFKQLYPDARLFIKEFPPRSITTAHIERYVSDLINIKGVQPDALVIDYLNLVLSTSASADNMYMGGIDVSEKLRGLSYTYGIPVITAAQVNTQGMNNEHVDMANIAESRGIAHTCDLILGLFQTEQARADQQIAVRILKNRLGGQIGKVVPFNLHPSTLVLTDVGAYCATASASAIAADSTVHPDIDLTSFDDILDL